MKSRGNHPGLRPTPVLAGLALFTVLAAPAAAALIHQQIQGPFADLRAVTGKCLECHRRQADEMLRSTHWTWERQRVLNGEKVSAGKKDSLAGFAIDVKANPERCLRCHISSNPKMEDPANPAADLVDCLACHDTTGLHRHGGEPLEPPPDLTTLARNVGRPTPRNCTGCHFADCGLSPVDQQDANAARAADRADVHLRASGPAFTCQTCHLATDSHTLVRAKTETDSPDRSAGCTSCHPAAPHALEQLNRHGRTIACQTCHIPSYGRDLPVLISWNWLMTGMINTVFRAAAGLQVHDQNGFWSAGDVEPVYLWDDGSDQVYTRGLKIQPRELTILQGPGRKTDAAKISPFRVLYGTQLYDSKYRYLISPLLRPEGAPFPPGPDWETLARKGMETMVLPFSGQYGFTVTAGYRRLDHGVAPAAEALDCLDCHGATGRIRWDMLGFTQDPMENSPPVSGDEQEAAPPAPEQEQPRPAEPSPALPSAQEPAVPALPVR